MTVTVASAAMPQDVAYGTVGTTPTETEEAVSTVKVTGAGTAEAIVREYFKDIPIMVQVARCESTFRHTLSDGTVLRGKVDPADTGVMQINTRFHGAKAASLGLDLQNIYDNMAYARFLYESQGTQPWSASSPCWGQTLAYNS